MMTRLRRSLLLSALLAGAPEAIAQQADPMGPYRQLKICYAGRPGDPREQRFVALLRDHFAQVSTLDLELLSKARVSGHDVVVADWSRAQAEDSSGKKIGPPQLQLPPSWSKSTVLVGAIAGSLTRKTGSKIDRL